MSMSRKQLLVITCGTTALVLVILLMVLLPAGGVVDATSNLSTESAQTEDSGVTGLSGGNDCYCSPDSNQQPDTEEPVPSTR